jgi:hypothetical protein
MATLQLGFFMGCSFCLLLNNVYRIPCRNGIQKWACSILVCTHFSCRFFSHSSIITKPFVNEIACPTVRYDYTQT